jgi:hypothetical protein
MNIFLSFPFRYDAPFGNNGVRQTGECFHFHDLIAVTIPVLVRIRSHARFLQVPKTSARRNPIIMPNLVKIKEKCAIGIINKQAGIHSSLYSEKLRMKMANKIL